MIWLIIKPILPYLIIAGIGTGGFFWIKGLYKKNKSLQREVDHLDKVAEDRESNIKNYKIIIEKLNNKKKESEDVKNNIDNAVGNDLAILANGL